MEQTNHCVPCRGTGKVDCPVCGGDGAMPQDPDRPCSCCDGRGYVLCSCCGGSGRQCDPGQISSAHETTPPNR